MTYEHDFSPAKLLLCKVIVASLDASPEGKSDMNQLLYSKMRDEDRAQLHQRESRFLQEMRGGWEPTKTEALSFFRGSDPVNDVVNLCVQELTDSITCAHDVVVWLLSLQRWTNQYAVDEIPEDTQELFLFVSSTVASFQLLPFAAFESVASSVRSFLSEEPSGFIQFPPPLLSYHSSFSASQRLAWIECVQSVLYRKSKELDLPSIKAQLLRVVPPPNELLASIALLEGHGSEAEALLHEAFNTSSLFSLLYPLTQYFMSRGAGPLAESFLRDFERVVHKCRNRRELAIASYLQFLLLDDEASLSMCVSSQQEFIQKGAVFSVLRRSPIFPRDLTMLQRLLPSHPLLLPKRNFTSVEAVLEVCDGKSMNDVIMDYVMKEQDALLPFLSATDLQFIEAENEFAVRVQTHLNHHRLSEARAAVRVWKSVCSSKACPVAEKEVEAIQCDLFGAVIENRSGWKERAEQMIRDCRERSESRHYDLWTAICDLVLVFILEENGTVHSFALQRLYEAVALFYVLRQPRLLRWSCFLLAKGEQRVDVVRDLKGDSVLLAYVKASLFERGLVSFAEFIKKCSISENYALVALVMRNPNHRVDEDVAKKWEELRVSNEPWHRLMSLAYSCLLFMREP